MIQAMIFDLDGTLVQTEKLKALSYAKAAIELCPHAIRKEQVLEAYKEVVGQSRQKVAETIMQHFDLEKRVQSRMAEFGVNLPWQAFVQVRLNHYESMLVDPDVIRNNRWPHNLAVLEEAKQANCKIGLATMSHCAQVNRILEILELTDVFDFVASLDDVEHGKPDPEIYLLVSDVLQVPPEQCLVIEDSPSGVKAAQAAGMWCIAVTTQFTREGVHALGTLKELRIVDEPTCVTEVVRQLVAERAKNG